MVDWSHLAVGNILAGSIHYLCEFLITGKDKMKKFFKYFCMENITQKKWLKEWIPIVAAARLAEGKLRIQIIIGDGLWYQRLRRMH